MKTSASAESIDRRVRCGLVLGIAASLATILFAIAGNFSLKAPFVLWDDALIYARYGENVVASGAIVWNLGTSPTYGVTSPLFLLLAVVPGRFIFPSNLALTVVAASLGCGLVFLGLLAWLIGRETTAPPLGRLALTLGALFTLAVANDNFIGHFFTGMDTTFALAYLTLYTIVCTRFERAPAAALAVLAGVLGGLTVFARPDLAAYALALPASMIALAGDRRARTLALVALGLTVVIGAAQVAFAAWYFGSALPLGFYAKTGHLYGGGFREQLRFEAVLQLHEFVRSYLYLFWTTTAAVVLAPRRWWRETSAVDKGLLAATAVFIAYYTVFVDQLMGGAQRFFIPTLPALLCVAAQSATVLARAVNESFPGLVAAARSHLTPRIGAVVALCLLSALFVRAFPDMGHVVLETARGRLLRVSALASYRERLDFEWFRLDEISTLPDALVIAASEVGHVGALNPRKVVIDLAGITDTELGRARFSAATFFRTRRPDLIYMPSAFYPDMNAELVGSPYFREHYERISPPGGAREVAILRTGRFYPELRRILARP